MIQTNTVYLIRDNKSKQWFSNIMQNFSNGNHNHNSNIKYVNSTIKCLGFKRIYYAINLDFVSSPIVFNNFDYMFLSMYN